MNTTLEAAIKRYRLRDWLPEDNATGSWPQYEKSQQSISDVFKLGQAYIDLLDKQQQDKREPV